MSFWNRFRRRRTVRALTLEDWVPADTISVTPDSSMRLAAVYSAVSLLATAVSGLPAVLYRKDKDGIIHKEGEHPLVRLLRVAPNAVMSPADYLEAKMSALLLRGNAYSRIYRSPLDGRVTALVPLDASSVQVLPTEDKSSLVYRVSGFGRDLLKSEVWHVRAFTMDGITGLSPISMARQTFELSMRAEKATVGEFNNASRPSGLLSAEGDISEEDAKEMAEAWKRAHSGSNTGSVAVLGSGMKFTPYTLPAADAAWIETRKFQRTEIAALFRVPVHMIGSLERATWANIESLGQEFVTYSLRHWLVKIEQSFLRDVLLPSEVEEGYYLRLNAEALLRGSLLDRMQAAQIKIQNGLASPNEIRALEEENPRPGGDAYLTPLNMRATGNGDTLETNP